MAAGQIFQDGDVYILTFKGSKELQASETGLAALPLELLVQIDGRATTGEIRARMKALTDDARFDAAMRQLVAEGYVDIASNLMTVSSDFIEFFSATSKPPSDSALDQAQSAASSGITTLQRHGYYVRIAMRGSGAAPSGQIRVLVVEDDETLSKFLRQYLELEGFAATVAGNRAEIIAGLRQQPPPDLVLLDVMLPDADGFDVLLKMRAHPALKAVPVLMLTAKATRESVLKGLAGGANGYITKPFQPDALIAAVKTVLGLSKNPFERDAGRIE
ncbi:MAG: response regulator transcription factor [Burkholderiales bacterium]|nr:response regulator transcription factor [Burkholderiales bacterium]